MMTRSSDYVTVTEMDATFGVIEARFTKLEQKLDSIDLELQEAKQLAEERHRSLSNQLASLFQLFGLSGSANMSPPPLSTPATVALTTSSTTDKTSEPTTPSPKQDLPAFKDSSTRGSTVVIQDTVLKKKDLPIFERGDAHTRVSLVERFFKSTLSSAVVNQDMVLQNIDLQIFDGKDAQIWLSLVERFFSLGNYSDDDRLLLISLGVSGKNCSGYVWEISRAPFKDWVVYKAKFLLQFGRSNRPLPIARLYNLVVETDDNLERDEMPENLEKGVFEGRRNTLATKQMGVLKADVIVIDGLVFDDTVPAKIFFPLQVVNFSILVSSLRPNELENACLVTVILLVISFACLEWDPLVEICKETSYFLQQLCRSSSLTLRMFIAIYIRGVPFLVGFLEPDYVKHSELVRLAIDGMWHVFELKGSTPGNDFYSIAAKHRILLRLLNTLYSLSEVTQRDSVSVDGKLLVNGQTPRKRSSQLNTNTSIFPQHETSFSVINEPDELNIRCGGGEEPSHPLTSTSPILGVHQPHALHTDGDRPRISNVAPDATKDIIQRHRASLSAIRISTDQHEKLLDGSSNNSRLPLLHASNENITNGDKDLLNAEVAEVIRESDTSSDSRTHLVSKLHTQDNVSTPSLLALTFPKDSDVQKIFQDVNNSSEMAELKTQVEKGQLSAVIYTIISILPTFKRLRTQSHWKGMNAAVKKYMAECVVCHTHKYNTVKLADKRRRELEFNIKDFVFLILRQYWQHSISHRLNQMLAAKFYGPFKLIERIVTVAYRLLLPRTSRIHLVFHISLLKPVLGKHHEVSTLPTYLHDAAELVIVPRCILETRYDASGHLEVLVEWEGLQIHERNWLNIGELHDNFLLARLRTSSPMAGR